tara:strand:- start:3496 stop:4185 length:690 start_codon:yes stop_codon:yes gene_type:complete
MSNNPVIILMARWPGACRCKKRLAITIGVEKAAHIQKNLTSHTLKVVSSIQKKGFADIHLAIAGISPKACKKLEKSQKTYSVIAQGKGSLGVRLKKQLLRAQKLRTHSQRINPRNTIIIGTDLPTLCENDLLEASFALMKNDLVIGPSKDGGYWLIGFSSELIKDLPHWPFCGISWGRNDVLQTTLKRAQEKNINFHLLREQNDIDHIKDLDPWLRKIHSQNLVSYAPL